MKRGFSGIKDQDREILLHIQNDEDLLKACSLNKYFYKEVCDDMFFRNRLMRTCSDTLKYKVEDETWKNYFVKVIYYISKMKEDYKYEHKEGNPIISYKIFKEIKNRFLGVSIESRYYNNELLVQGSIKGELSLIKEALKRGADIHAYNEYSLRMASRHGHFEIVKYLIENGADIHPNNDEALTMASYNGHLEIVKYLQTLK